MILWYKIIEISIEKQISIFQRLEMVGNRDGAMGEKHKRDIWGEGTILNLDCTGGYRNLPMW